MKITKIKISEIAPKNLFIFEDTLYLKVDPDSGFGLNAVDMEKGAIVAIENHIRVKAVEGELCWKY